MRNSASDIWHPDETWLTISNLVTLMRRLGTPSYDVFLKLSVDSPEKYWEATLEHLGIQFDPPAEQFLDVSEGKPWAKFFPGAGFNFAAACVRPPADCPERVALSWESEDGRCGNMSYVELEKRTRQFAAGLLKLGVKPGDRVGLLFPNIPEAVISFLAICYIGAIAVPLYSGYGVDAIVSRLMDAEVICLVTADGFLRRGRYVSLAKLVSAVQERILSLEKVVMVRREGDAVVPFPFYDWHIIENNGDVATAAPTAANDPFMVIYTSGTTGKPKGAVHVHGGFPLRVAQDVAYLFDFKAGDRYFWMSDMGWMVGPFSICSTLMLKGSYVIYDGSPDVPDIGRLRDIAARHRVTHFGSSPTSVRAMAADENVALAPNASDLRVLMTGGEVMDADSHRWYFQRFGSGNLPIINYTGGTEVSGAILTNVVVRPIAPSRFNSTAPGVSACVVDSTGQTVHGAPGELAIAQPFVGMTRGFWRDTERYLETYWSRMPGLWVHGDLAVAEEDGQYLLLGRSDDVMKISGKRVGPSEVEGIVADGKCITEAVVFGVPDARSGEAMVVLVVRGSDQEYPDGLDQQVTTLLRAAMGPTFRPHAVVPVQRIVKTRNGKVIRRLARQAWLGEAPGDLNSVEDPTVFGEMAESCRLYREEHGRGS
ncbi:AMP-binding protein [Noviherbaspirillum sedimenti]|nr:AMP-binding protein [Noviherbaspirillum sedimenti]